jgi:hypothetical protein
MLTGRAFSGGRLILDGISIGLEVRLPASVMPKRVKEGGQSAYKTGGLQVKRRRKNERNRRPLPKEKENLRSSLTCCSPSF